MRAPAFALLLGGCSFTAIAPGSSPNGASDSEPPIIDGAVLDGKVTACAGSFVRICVDPPPAAVTLTTQKIDTTNSTLCAAYSATPNTPDACVISGQSITIPSGNTISVVGNRQLILFSTGSITITGTLDAAGHGKTSGPGGNTGACGADATSPTRGIVGGGGWGGSFGSKGGDGGNGVSGKGGKAAPAITPTGLRGGCPGGNGADNGFGSGGGDRGGGGGAVLVIATSTITIDGVVNASGGSGGHGTFGGGGGGGGAGGMIVLDAGAAVNTPGTCFANGGGAGEGANVHDGRNGNESRAPDSIGTGGTGGALTGGDGGDGAAGVTPSAAGSNGIKGNQQTGQDGAGGGGGGGVGVIQVYASDQLDTDNLQNVAPPPSPHS